MFQWFCIDGSGVQQNRAALKCSGYASTITITDPIKGKWIQLNFVVFLGFAVGLKQHCSFSQHALPTQVLWVSCVQAQELMCDAWTETGRELCSPGWKLFMCLCDPPLNLSPPTLLAICRFGKYSMPHNIICLSGPILTWTALCRWYIKPMCTWLY